MGPVVVIFQDESEMSDLWSRLRLNLTGSVSFPCHGEVQLYSGYLDMVGGEGAVDTEGTPWQDRGLVDSFPDVFVKQTKQRGESK